MNQPDTLESLIEKTSHRKSILPLVYKEVFVFLKPQKIPLMARPITTAGTTRPRKDKCLFSKFTNTLS
jgi:hypothetical protein